MRVYEEERGGLGLAVGDNELERQSDDHWLIALPALWLVIGVVCCVVYRVNL